MAWKEAPEALNGSDSEVATEPCVVDRLRLRGSILHLRIHGWIESSVIDEGVSMAAMARASSLAIAKWFIRYLPRIGARGG